MCLDEAFSLYVYVRACERTSVCMYVSSSVYACACVYGCLCGSLRLFVLVGCVRV